MAQTKMEQAMKEADRAVKEAAVAQRNVDQALTHPGRTRNGYRSLATTFDDAESDLNHGLRNLHHVVLSTATATKAWS